MRKTLNLLIVSAALICVSTQFSFQSVAFAAKPKTDTDKGSLNASKLYWIPIKHETISDLKLLPFKEIVQLERARRVQYIQFLQSVALKAEKMQILFRKSDLSASLDVVPKGISEELFALILGRNTYAASDEEQSIEAGADCIYAYGISRMSSRNLFSCKPPEPCKTAHGASGVRCRPMISGIPEDNPAGCISNQIRWRATSACRDAQIELMNKSDNKEKLKTMKNQAFDFLVKIEKLRIAGKSEQEINAELKNSEFQKIMFTLAQNRYDPEVFSFTIEMLMAIKKYGLKLEIDKLTLSSKDKKAYEKIYKSVLDDQNLADGINGFTTALGNIFGKYKNHCDRPLSEDILKNLNVKNYAKNMERTYGPGPGRLSQIRENAFKKIMDENNVSTQDLVSWAQKAENRGKITNRTVWETKECQLFDFNYHEIKAAAQRHFGSLPQGHFEPRPTTEPTEPTPNYAIKPTGCQSTFFGRTALFQDSTMCGMCLAERAALKAKLNGVVSQRWEVLTSTMGTACGGSLAKGKILPMYTKVAMQQAFGFCVQDPTEDNNYEFDVDSVVSDEDAKSFSEFLEKFQTNNMWQELFKNKDSNESKFKYSELNKNFEKIFGISFYDASKIFCHPNTFTFNRDREIIDYNEKFLQSNITESQDLKARQKNFEDQVGLINSGQFPNNSIKDKPIAKCLNSALKVMQNKEIYDGGSRGKNQGPACMTSTAWGNLPNHVDKIFNELDAGGGLVAYSTTGCYIGIHRENPDKKTDYSAVALQSPSFDGISPSKARRILIYKNRHPSAESPTYSFYKNNIDNPYAPGNQYAMVTRDPVDTNIGRRPQSDLNMVLIPGSCGSAYQPPNMERIKSDK